MWTSCSTASFGDLVRRLEHRADGHVEAEIGKGGGDHLLAAVVAVLSHLGDEDARLAPVFFSKASTLSWHALDGRVVAERPCDRRRRSSARSATWRPKTFSSASEISPTVAPGARGADGELEQIAVAVGGTGQRVERGLDGGDVARALELLQLGELARAHLGIVDLEHVDLDVLVRAGRR